MKKNTIDSVNTAENPLYICNVKNMKGNKNHGTSAYYSNP